jgi:hypothetical protein
VLVTCGLDEYEVTSQPWAGRAEVVDIAPGALGKTHDELVLPKGTLERPPLYTRLSEVVGRLYESEAVVPPAAQLCRSLASKLPDGGVVVAEPGLVGYWVARTFPTSVPGSVIVPATGGRQAALDAARGAAGQGRPVTFVTVDDGIEPWAELVTVEHWGSGVDLDPSELIDVAGPIVAWGGL